MATERMVKREQMAVEGGTLPVELWEYELDSTDPDNHGYYITVDGVEWCDCNAAHHAMILFDLIKEHANEKMRYTLING